MSALCQKQTHALQQLMPNLREAVPIANLPSKYRFGQKPLPAAVVHRAIGCLFRLRDPIDSSSPMSVMRTRTVARMAATITNLLLNKGYDGSDSRANKNRLYVRTD